MLGTCTLKAPQQSSLKDAPPLADSTSLSSVPSCCLLLMFLSLSCCLPSHVLFPSCRLSSCQSLWCHLPSSVISPPVSRPTINLSPVSSSEESSSSATFLPRKPPPPPRGTSRPRLPSLTTASDLVPCLKGTRRSPSPLLSGLGWDPPQGSVLGAPWWPRPGALLHK